MRAFISSGGAKSCLSSNNNQRRHSIDSTESFTKSFEAQKPPHMQQVVVAVTLPRSTAWALSLNRPSDYRSLA